jgi:hypothetical protein
MTAVYPASIFPWTNRVDQVNVIWANDPNSMAAELISIETTLGVMPQVEKAPYEGNSVTYASVDARLSDLLAANQHPYVELSASNFYVNNNERYNGRWGHCNYYQRVYDSHGSYNGTDITVPCSGLWLIVGEQNWEWHDSGYCFHHCYIDNDWRAGHRWDWDFANAGPGDYDDSRQLTTHISWMGPITGGKRVQIISENGTSRSPYKVNYSYLRAYCLRKLPTSALSS